jgi:predicted RNase H-like HicB family nuclease
MAIATHRFKVFLEWDPDDRVWVTYVPVLNHLSTFGITRDEALRQTREAVVRYLEAAAEHGIPSPHDAGTADIVEIEVSVPSAPRQPVSTPSPIRQASPS